MRNTLYTDRIVIIGAGLGGLYAALALAPRRVVVISPDTLGAGASSAWAQGGVAAAMAQADSPAAHAADTIRVGAGIVDRDVAHMVTSLARDHILNLTALGAPFDRSATGEYVLSREAAHSVARVVRVQGDQAGAAIMAALIEKVRAAPHIQVLERTMAVGLETDAGAVTSVSLQSAAPARSAPVRLRGRAFLLAGGGSGGLYALTTNPPQICGQVIGMAARAGAQISDAEFVQFHPTAIDVGEDPAPLATEALRGEGALLVNACGERFMDGLHPDRELAPRDIVARAVYQQSRAGKRPMLDTRAALGDRLQSLYPAVWQACMRNGLNPVTHAIPVVAAAHYHMGGITTNSEGKASLGNLWVCGEASSTGLHGANRLASNGLLEALVYARICASSIMATHADCPDAPEVTLRFGHGGPAPPADAIRALRHTMTQNVGVLRDHAGLQRALCDIARLEAAHPHVPEFLNMCATATLIAAGARARCESRGAHERADFAGPPEGRGHRSITTFTAAMAQRDQITKDLT